MAIYKRYNTRKKKIHWGWILWTLLILAVFAATVVLGHYLGEKAKDGESLLPAASGSPGDNETITPLAERIMRGEYVEPTALAAFTTDDPFTYASTWLYHDGTANFAVETDRKLGRDVSALPALTAFSIDAGTTGLFEVQSVYADEQVRDVIAAYESALLAEFAAAQPSEIVLVFDKLDAEFKDRIFAYAKSVSGAVLCVPYAILGDENCARFFSEAGDAGLSVALRVTDLTPEQLAADIEDFAFYFTRYELRLVLDGSDEALVDVLREKNALNYQFCSPRASTATATTEGNAQ